MSYDGQRKNKQPAVGVSLQTHKGDTTGLARIQDCFGYKITTGIGGQLNDIDINPTIIPRRIKGVEYKKTIRLRKITIEVSYKNDKKNGEKIELRQDNGKWLEITDSLAKKEYKDYVDSAKKHCYGNPPQSIRCKFLIYEKTVNNQKFRDVILTNSDSNDLKLKISNNGPLRIKRQPIILER